MILIIIKFCELLLRISPRIINSLRSYIKHSKECFLLFPNTSKLVKINSTAPRFSNLLLGVWKSEETLFLVFDLLHQTRDTVLHHISNTEKRVENTTRSGVFLTNLGVFDVVMKHCDECLIQLLKQTDFEGEIKDAKARSFSSDIQTCHGT